MSYPIEITVRRNCKRLVLRYHPGERRLTLSVPPGTSKAAIDRFLAAEQPWIARHVAADQPYRPTYAPGERHLLFGQWLTLGAPGQPATEAELAELRSRMLQAYILRELPEWTSRMHVTVSRIRLRDMTSRWGSCQTVTHVLTINLRLALVPERCVTYVLVHELCHLLHPDHSAAFHEEMTRLMPDWPALRRQLADLDLTPQPPAGDVSEPSHIR